jgi:uncharacterized protein (DUF1697 family)
MVRIKDQLKKIEKTRPTTTETTEEGVFSSGENWRCQSKTPSEHPLPEKSRGRAGKRACEPVAREENHEKSHAGRGQEIKWQMSYKMPTYVALLRGVNVSGKKLIKMADLQWHFESCGAVNVRTYIQSGNVIFEHGTAHATFQNTLEQHLAVRLGYTVPALIKTAKEFAAIAQANPYDTRLPEFGKKMFVCFFANPPTVAAVQSIQSLVNDDERLVVIGDAGYAYYANGLGRAKLSSTVIERKLGTATLRTWNTVTALLEMAKS